MRLQTILFLSLILVLLQVQVEVSSINESLDIDSPHFEFQVAQTPTDNIVSVGEWSFGPCHAVFVDGDLAYIGKGNHVEILDISNPSQPTSISSVNLGYVVEGIYSEGDYIYAACRLGGLQIIDIHDITTPRKISQLKTPTWATGLLVESGIAYLFMSYRGLTLIDVGDPLSPTEISQCDTSGSVRDAIKIENYIYAADSHGGVLVFDVTSKSSPVEIGHCETDFSSTGIGYDGGHVYLASVYNGLEVVNVIDPSQPFLVSQHDTIEPANDVQVVGKFAYVSEGDPAGTRGALTVFDITSPSNPISIGRCVTSGPGDEVVLSGSLAFLPVSEMGLSIVSIEDAYAPQEVGHYDAAGVFWGLALDNDLVYIANGLGGLRVLNVNDASNPFEVGTFETLGHAVQVSVLNNRAYVADRENGLWILNVSDPSDISLLGHCKLSDYTYDVVVVQQFAYLACGIDGLRIVNISDPTSPFEVGAYGVYMDIESLHVTGDYAYLVYEGGLVVVDVSVPSNPTYRASKSNRGHSTGIHVKDGIAIVTVADFGVEVYDISSQRSPQLIVEHSITGWIRDVFIDGELAFVTCDHRGVAILTDYKYVDVKEAASWATNGFSDGVLYREGYIYVTELYSGLWILEHDVDGDNLFSRTEVDLGTSPTDPDSDSDQMPDGWEVLHSLNPLLDDSQLDPDMDGLTNLMEYKQGTDPQVFNFANNENPDSPEDPIEYDSPENGVSFVQLILYIFPTWVLGGIVGLEIPVVIFLLGRRFGSRRSTEQRRIEVEQSPRDEQRHEYKPN
ncbi:MAG: LVIVD repeat-containing protein [Candidatus Thorarchaeota archaeon]|jgi:hypothetical protein